MCRPAEALLTATHHALGNHSMGVAKTAKKFYTDASRYTRMHTDTDRLNELSGAIIGCTFTVLNAPWSRVSGEGL
jgi:hypothetical protein